MDTKFENLYPGDATFERSSRVMKANKIIAVISDYKKSQRKISLLDYGCSVGYMTDQFGKKFDEVYGVDIDAFAINRAIERNKAKNVVFRVSGKDRLDFPDDRFDAVVFNQIYEHVENPQKLLDEIFRVLKPGGICYFGARNKYFPMDGHYPIPFLALFPKKIANRIMKVSLGRNDYDIKLYSLWELKKLVKRFEVVDYTLEVFRNPKKYYLNNFIKLFYPFANLLYFLIPNYVWILVKK